MRSHWGMGRDSLPNAKDIEIWERLQLGEHRSAHCYNLFQRLLLLWKSQEDSEVEAIRWKVLKPLHKAHAFLWRP